MMKQIFSDEKLQQITGQVFIGQAILVAHEIGLFEVLSKQAKTLKTIMKRLKLEERAVQALLSSAAILDLVDSENEKFKLTPLGKFYLDPNSPSYYGCVLDLLIQESEVMNYSIIKQAIITNLPQINKGKDLFCNKDSVGNTEKFVNSLHQKAFAPAFAWTKQIDLTGHKKFVDIGGGSGIHSIAACLNNPFLNAIVCDRSSVLAFTKKHIKEFQISKKVSVKSLNMWENAFPESDIYFLGDIFHDWDQEKCFFLAKKCFDSLLPGGKIILHEMLFNNAKTKPFLSSAYNMKMLLWTEGQQFSKAEIKIILRKAGFKNIKIKNTLGNWSIVVGNK